MLRRIGLTAAAALMAVPAWAHPGHTADPGHAFASADHLVAKLVAGALIVAGLGMALRGLRHHRAAQAVRKQRQETDR